jgi:hypothetical protein
MGAPLGADLQTNFRAGWLAEHYVGMELFSVPCIAARRIALIN